MTGPSSTPARRFLMVHGVQHRRPREHWLWWLTEELRRRGEQVLYPQFPAPEQPSVSEWTDLLHAELAQLGDSERVVVCHSLGCALWLRAAQALPPELRVSRVLLVSPLGPQAFTAANGNEEFALDRVDPALLAAASTTPPRAVVSATDPYAPADPRGWSAGLGLDCDVLPAAGHVTPADGYGPWPAALAWCLREQTPVGPTVRGSSTTVTWHLAAPRSAVYRALLDRAAVQQWKVPPGMTSQVHEWDAREGGRLRVSLTYDSPDRTGKTSGRTDTYSGSFTELVPDRRVVEVDRFETDDPALGSPMTITVTLADAAGGGTELVAVHDGLPAGVRPEDNELGWRESLTRLAALVEPDRSSGSS